MRGLREKGKGEGSAGMPRGGVRGSRQGQVSVANGNRAILGRSLRVGVTSDEAENAPRLRVTYGEDSKESGPPVKRRVKTHTASAQDSSTPVPWRWRSRGASIRGSHRPRPVVRCGGVPPGYRLGFRARVGRRGGGLPAPTA